MAGQRYDTVIVGGGSAGCVLAARLSEDPFRRVLLLEAGPGYPPDGYPPDLTTGTAASVEPARNWGLASVPGPTGHPIAAHAGRVLGGGSATNGGISRRARPSDFARWVAHGLPEWSFEHVLDTFKELETTETGDDRWHGRSGPWPVRQWRPEDLPTPVRAFLEAAAAGEGYGLVDDFNDPEHEGGVGGEAVNIVDGERRNTAMTFLTEQVRARPNLTIRCDAIVERVLIEVGHAAGVLLEGGKVVEAGEVVLSAGVYGSSALLLRSGIGPSAHLRALGIRVAADLPVGERLRDQPMVVLFLPLKEQAGGTPPLGSGVLWISSSEAEPGEFDLQLSISVQPDLDPAGLPVQALSVWATVVLPRSAGTLRLKDPSPQITPRIDYQLLSDPSDRRRLRELLAIVRRTAARDPLAGLVDAASLDAMGSTEAELDAFIDARLTTFLHGTSTAPMGGPGDPGAVVDGEGRVRGIGGLRVVDASIIPEPVSVPVNLTTIMVAKRIAGLMRSGR